MLLRQLRDFAKLCLPRQIAPLLRDLRPNDLAHVVGVPHEVDLEKVSSQDIFVNVDKCPVRSTALASRRPLGCEGDHVLVAALECAQQVVEQIPDSGVVDSHQDPRGSREGRKPMGLRAHRFDFRMFDAVAGQCGRNATDALSMGARLLDEAKPAQVP
jgi:hypothetical protein